jgi:hypothetical protein
LPTPPFEFTNEIIMLAIKHDCRSAGKHFFRRAIRRAAGVGWPVLVGGRSN